MPEESKYIRNVAISAQRDAVVIGSSIFDAQFGRMRRMGELRGWLLRNRLALSVSLQTKQYTFRYLPHIPVEKREALEEETDKFLGKKGDSFSAMSDKLSRHFWAVEDFLTFKERLQSDSPIADIENTPDIWKKTEIFADRFMPVPLVMYRDGSSIFFFMVLTPQTTHQLEVIITEHKAACLSLSFVLSLFNFKKDDSLFREFLEAWCVTRAFRSVPHGDTQTSHLIFTQVTSNPNKPPREGQSSSYSKFMEELD